MVEGIITSRQKGKDREFLVKFKGIAEPTWQPSSNHSLKAHYNHYYDMMNCTFDYFPTVFSKNENHFSIQLENDKLLI